MEANPYKAPEANVDTIATGEIDDVETIRNEYINHEASLRSIGLLYYLGGFFVIVMSVIALLGMMTKNNDFPLWGWFLILGFGCLQLWIGRGFRKLNSKIKIPATIFSAIGLLSVPIGTLINGYILYLIYSAKGNMVFSEEYRKVIAATPNIKYKTSIIIWIFLGIVVLGIAAAVLLPMFAPR